MALLAAACGDGAADTAAADAAVAQAEAAEAEAAAMEADEARKALEGSMMVEAPEIREAEVAMGFNACCADMAFWRIPVDLGWWDDLNITIVPNSPTYYFAAGAEAIA